MLQRIIAPIWGLAGVLWLLGFAIYRLTPVAVDAIKEGLTAFQWVVLVVWALFMAVAEGYRGLSEKVFTANGCAGSLFARSPQLVANPVSAGLLHGLFSFE